MLLPGQSSAGALHRQSLQPRADPLHRRCRSPSIYAHSAAVYGAVCASYGPICASYGGICAVYGSICAVDGGVMILCPAAAGMAAIAHAMERFVLAPSVTILYAATTDSPSFITSFGVVLVGQRSDADCLSDVGRCGWGAG
eukprot:2541826-Rhodomonas_salina.2